MHGQSSRSVWRGDNVHLDVKRYAFKTAGLFQSFILEVLHFSEMSIIFTFRRDYGGEWG